MVLQMHRAFERCAATSGVGAMNLDDLPADLTEHIFSALLRRNTTVSLFSALERGYLLGRVLLGKGCVTEPNHGVWRLLCVRLGMDTPTEGTWRATYEALRDEFCLLNGVAHELIEAYIKGQANIARMWLEMTSRGAKAFAAGLHARTPSLMETVDSEGRSTLVRVCTSPSTNHAGLARVTAFLVAHKADVHVRFGPLGKTPLMLALKKESVVRELLRTQTPEAKMRMLEAKTFETRVLPTNPTTKYSPLMIATLQRAAPTVKLLLEHRADVHATDGAGDTALANIPLCLNPKDPLDPIERLLVQAGAFATNRRCRPS